MDINAMLLTFVVIFLDLIDIGSASNRACMMAMRCAMPLDTHLSSSNVAEACKALPKVITCMESHMAECTGARAADIQGELDNHRRRKSDKCELSLSQGCSIKECLTDEVKYAASKPDKQSLCLLLPSVKTCMKDALSSAACSKDDRTMIQKEMDGWVTNCPGGNSSGLKSSSSRVTALASLLMMLIGVLGVTL